jgi:hypothetical protein
MARGTLKVDRIVPILFGVFRERFGLLRTACAPMKIDKNFKINHPSAQVIVLPVFLVETAQYAVSPYRCADNFTALGVLSKAPKDVESFFDSYLCILNISVLSQPVFEGQAQNFQCHSFFYFLSLQFKV